MARKPLKKSMGSSMFWQAGSRSTMACMSAAALAVIFLSAVKISNRRGMSSSLPMSSLASLRAKRAASEVLRHSRSRMTSERSPWSCGSDTESSVASCLMDCQLCCKSTVVA